MISLNLSSQFLTIVRLGIGHTSSCILPDSFEWERIQVIAAQHGLSAVLLDAIEKLPESIKPHKGLVMQWIGETLKNYECRYDLYCRTISELTSFYREHGIKMMVLKGFGCSLNWPRPEHRPCGDIDIWLFGKQAGADALMKKEKSVKIDNTHHHHTLFYWSGFAVENHYDFLNIYHHRSNVELESILKELGKDDSHFVELNGEKIYLPSPNLHALFLLRHSMSDFASTGIKLRQLLDWAFFVEKEGKHVDWEWLYEIVDRFGMEPLFQVFNAICVEDLGFESSIFPEIQFRPFIKDRVLNDIIFPEFSEKEKGGLICRAIFKYRRWKANSWKHELCFNDSLQSAFWSGIKGHLTKPGSI